MLSSLYIRDFALIDELEVEFSNGFTIITGETGAGKSILVGALKLILGDRAQTDTIRQGASKAIVEGVFEASDVVEVNRLLQEGGFDISDQPHEGLGARSGDRGSTPHVIDRKIYYR